MSQDHRLARRIAGFAAPLAVAAVLAAPGAAPAADFPLQAFWPMNEGRGQVVHDFSGKGNNGILGDSPVADGHDPTWIKGIFGSALRFDGGDFVTIPDSASLHPQQLTVSLWFRGSSSPGSYRYLISRG